MINHAFVRFVTSLSVIEFIWEVTWRFTVSLKIGGSTDAKFVGSRLSTVTVIRNICGRIREKVRWLVRFAVNWSGDSIWRFILEYTLVRSRRSVNFAGKHLVRGSIWLSIEELIQGKGLINVKSVRNDSRNEALWAPICVDTRSLNEGCLEFSSSSVIVILCFIVNKQTNLKIVIVLFYFNS